MLPLDPPRSMAGAGTRRVGLSRNGYNGAPLHARAHPNKAPSQQTCVESAVTRDDGYAQPGSSGDEAKVSPKRKLADGESSSPRKRNRLPVSGTSEEERTPGLRQSRRQLVARNSRHEEENENADPREEEMFGFASSQEARRRPVRKHKFGSQAGAIRKDLLAKERGSKKLNHDSFGPPPRFKSQSPTGLETNDGFKMPQPLPELNAKAPPAPTFRSRTVLKEDPSKDIPPDIGFQQKALKIADPALRSEVQQVVEATSKFRLPPSSLEHVTHLSLSSLEPKVEGRFSLTFSRSRSSSRSSLLSGIQDKDSSEEAEVDAVRTPKCPLCEAPVPLEFFESYNNGRPLTYRDQHRFCYDHRLSSAKSQWVEHGYPTIDWQLWSDTRINKSHVSQLLQVLYGKDQRKSSYYARILLEHTSGGPKALQKYMKEGIVDVVSAGYYGPKGSKVASQAIQERLEGQLHDSASRNELVRDAGVGGYVQAVLVPELFVMLVKEDMKAKNGKKRDSMSDEEARQVLRESMECGILLNGEEEDAIDADEEDQDADDWAVYR